MQKTKFRKNCINNLKGRFALSSMQRLVQDKQVIKRLTKIITKEKAKNILFYMPFGFEINVLSLMKNLKKFKKTKRYNIFIPYIIGNTFVYSLYRLPIKKEPRFGIKQAKKSGFFYANKPLDVCIVPILGFDTTFRRVGFGLGMYDRFGKKIFKCSKKNHPKIVFVQNKICLSKCIVTNDYDIKGDYILSPKVTLKQTKTQRGYFANNNKYRLF